MKPRLDRLTVKNYLDEAPDTSYLEQEGFEERLEKYDSGLFGFIGILAEAEVSYPVDSQGNRRIEHFTSGGLWGIEDDSSPDYFEEIAQEELANLKEHLEVFGVDTSNWEELIAEGVTP